MKNGDVMTCEIRSLSQGQLTIKQGYANSTVSLDWNEVDHLVTQQPFAIIGSDGKSYSGAMSESAEDRILRITGIDNAAIPHAEVVSIQQTGTTFVRKLRGSFDLGLSFTKSNAQSNLTLNTDLNYQGEKHMGAFSSSTQFSTQQKTTNTSETTVKSGFFKELGRPNWYGGGIANLLSSSEQEIDVRTTFGAVLAMRPIFTNKTNLTLFGGLAYTLEKDAENAQATASKHSLDAAAAVEFSTFRFDSTTFDTTVWVYPSLTSAGRVRMTLNQDVYFKFLKDFYLRASFYDNYDNQPVVNAPPNNFGVTTTVGWSFR